MPDVWVAVKILQVLEQPPAASNASASEYSAYCDGCLFTYRSCGKCRRKLSVMCTACIHCPPTATGAAVTGSGSGSGVVYRYRFRALVSDTSGAVASVILFGDGCDSVLGPSGAHAFHHFVHQNRVFSASELHSTATNYLSGREVILTFHTPIVGGGSNVAAANSTTLSTVIAGAAADSVLATSMKPVYQTISLFDYLQSQLLALL